RRVNSHYEVACLSRVITRAELSPLTPRVLAIHRMLEGLEEAVVVDPLIGLVDALCIFTSDTVAVACRTELVEEVLCIGERTLCTFEEPFTHRTNAVTCLCAEDARTHTVLRTVECAS